MFESTCAVYRSFQQRCLASHACGKSLSQTDLGRKMRTIFIMQRCQ